MAAGADRLLRYVCREASEAYRNLDDWALLGRFLSARGGNWRHAE
jgi:hypothetical protein